MCKFNSTFELSRCRCVFLTNQIPPLSTIVCPCSVYLDLERTPSVLRLHRTFPPHEPSPLPTLRLDGRVLGSHLVPIHRPVGTSGKISYDRLRNDLLGSSSVCLVDLAFFRRVVTDSTVVYTRRAFCVPPFTR